MADREAKIERQRVAEARRDAKAKPTVSREAVDTLLAYLSPESRAQVVTAAIQHLRVRPDLPWMKY
jgi:hypothetical protein